MVWWLWLVLCVCVFFVFCFSLKERGRGLHSRVGTDVHCPEVGGIRVITQEKSQANAGGKLPIFVNRLQSGQGRPLQQKSASPDRVPPRHKPGLWRSGCWNEEEKAGITKCQTELLLRVSPDLLFRWHLRKGQPSASAGCGQWGPREAILWVRMTDPPGVLAASQTST